MPEQDGRLTKDEKDDLIRKILSLWKAPHNCPVCGDQNWIIGDHLVQPVTLGASRSIMLAGTGYPQVMLISSKCGYTMFLNAVVLGAVPPEAKEGSPLPPAGGGLNVKS
jgi:hypothetical protein